LHDKKEEGGDRSLQNLLISEVLGLNPEGMNDMNKSAAIPIPATAEVVPTKVGYDRWAEVYDGEDNPLVLLEERHIGSLLGEVSGLDVVDVGCGTGRHAVKLAIASAKVTAVDFSEAMLERARAKPGAEAVKFLQHDLADPLPFPTAAFDRVLCCLVLDHINDLQNFFAELRRVCRESGFVIISVMHPAMSLRGIQARFIEPGSGRRIGLASYEHQVSDYLMAAMRVGLILEHVSEQAVDAELVARSDRAEKYLGWPMLLLIRFKVK
jgi:malonyl-CoA O-methyltransferase